MRQQVNLYQDALKKPKLKYSAALLMQLSAVVVVVSILIGGYQYVRLLQQEKALQAEQQKQATVMAELKQLEYELSIRKRDLTLEDRLNDKEKELANK